MENKCPHLEVRFNAVRKVTTSTGSFRLTGPAWECVWCHQEFIPAPDQEVPVRSKERDKEEKHGTKPRPRK